MAVVNRLGERHFLYAPTPEAAAAIGATLERQGWEVSIDCDDDVCLVVATCLRVLSGPLAEETRAHLRSLVAHHGGEYDGWESATA